MSFLQELIRWNRPSRDVVRAYNPDWQSWVDSFAQFQGSLYQPSVTTTYAGQKVEPVGDSFYGYLNGAYKANGIVFAVSMARARLFSEARFKWRRYGQTGGGTDLFGNRDLRRLERPWPGGTTQSLLMRAEQDVTCGGTFFLAESEDGNRLLRRRPDWMEFVLTAPPDEAVESDVLGYKYTVGGPRSGGREKLYLMDECVHWAPIPDPDAMFRGMSWLTPVIEEMQADQAATLHKGQFFRNAATPNMVVTAPPQLTPDQFAEFARKANEAGVGIENAYKTMYLGGGATAQVVGANMAQMDFRSTQGAGETRVAAAGGVPPIIVGLSEGLSAATYSNYGQARRAFGDTWGSNQWRSFCGAIAPLLNEPADAELWYDTRDIPFLREDQKDLAEVQGTQASTINALVAGGWTAESSLAAVLAEDFSLLVHSGLMSVQLQAPAKPDANEEKASAEEAGVTSTQAATIAALGTGPWDPESVLNAVVENDLSLLELVEEEPVPGEEEIDPAVLEEDLADESLRHMPGKHNQGSHGNRFKTPGDRASGLLREGKERAARVPRASKAEPAAKVTSVNKISTEPVQAPDADPVEKAKTEIQSYVDRFPRNKRVPLDEIREHLANKGGMSWDETDEALISIGLLPDWKLEDEPNQKVLRDTQRISAVSFGNQPKYYVVHLNRKGV